MIDLPAVVAPVEMDKVRSPSIHLSPSKKMKTDKEMRKDLDAAKKELHRLVEKVNNSNNPITPNA